MRQSKGAHIRPLDARREPGRRGLERASGFSLLELMVVVVIGLLLATMGFPALSKMVHRERLLGFARTATTHMARARQEAVQRGVDVVVEPIMSERRILIFADVDGDLLYSPTVGAINRTDDYEVGRLELPTDSVINFEGPNDGPNGADALDGMTERPSDDAQILVFKSNGSVDEVGGIRIADQRGNILEIRVEPQATGRVRLLKYNGTAFYERAYDSGGATLWQWR